MIIDRNDALRNTPRIRNSPQSGGMKNAVISGGKTLGKKYVHRKVEHYIRYQIEFLVEKLNKEIERGNATKVFMLAMFIAGTKDALDMIMDGTGIGLIPGIGFLTGILTTFNYFFLLKKGWFLKTRAKIKIFEGKVGYWVLGFFIDGLPAINFLPINVIYVAYAWKLVRKRAKKAQKKLDNVHKLAASEIEKLNNDISIVDD